MRLIKKNVERITEDAVMITKLKAEGFEEVSNEKSQGGNQNKPGVDNGISLETMSAAELKKLAKEKGIEGYSSLSKDELLTVLKDVI